MDRYLVYEWTHLPTNKKYVGMTCDLRHRCWMHLNGKGGARYFNQFLQAHYEPEEWLIEVHTNGLTAQYLESIGYRLGHEMLNLSHGGEGCPGYKFTDEQKARHSLMAKECQNRPDVKARMSASCKGKKRTPEQNVRSSLLQKEIRSSPAARERIRQTLNRPEVRAKLSAAQRGKKASFETKEKR